MTTTKREMNAEERAELEKIAAELKQTKIDYSELLMFGYGILLLMLLAFCLWAVTSWFLWLLIDFDIGPKGPYGQAIKIIGGFGCAAYMIFVWFHHRNKFHKYREEYASQVLKSIEANVVKDESYQIKDVKRFIEPEHGGLIYFLLTSNNRILVLYDYESAELGTNGEDSLSGSFEVRNMLNIVKAPKSDHVLRQYFSGDLIEPHKPIDMTLPPEEWPEDATWYRGKWDRLEKRFGAGS